MIRGTKVVVCRGSTSWYGSTNSPTPPQAQRLNTLRSHKHTHQRTRTNARTHARPIRVQEVFHTPDHYYMVMDLYTGGDMYARYKFRSEDETAKIVNKLINALRYCHDRNIAVSE